jgi:addiction module RelE/StbE family toxin
MLDTDYTTLFVKDRKRCQKKHWDIALLNEAIIAVANSDARPMDQKFNDHALTGDKKGNRLLHINGRNSNWVMCRAHCALSKRLAATAAKDSSTSLRFARNDTETHTHTHTQCAHLALSFRAEGPSTRKTHCVFSEVGWELATAPGQEAHSREILERASARLRQKRP